MTPRLPLTGIRVLDCSRVLAGPFATMLLADLGAEVIKLEPPGGDETRDWGPPFWGDPGERRSAYFTSLNRGKQSIVVDLRRPEGRAILDRLAARSQLLVHNLRPASAARLGLAADRLREGHPHLVVGVVSGFSGADAERPAYDLLAQALTGLMSITGEAERGPVKVGVAVIDLLAGLEVAVGALAGLVARSTLDGPGSYVETSLMDAGVTGLLNVLANHLADGRQPQRWGTAHPNIVPYQVFSAADGDLALAVGNDAQFARLLDVLGLVDPEQRFATNPARLRRRNELVSLLGQAIAARGRGELLAALAEADIPAGPVNSVAEALAAARRAEPGGWDVEVDGGRIAPSPIRIDGRLLRPDRAPPRLGEHTDTVLSTAGYGSPEIDRLRAEGVVA